MHFGAVRGRRTAAIAALCALLVSTTCGGGVLEPEYEYEEELYLSLDGSATAYVHASVPALVALHGARLDPDPTARLDRDRVREIFDGAGSNVALSFSRRGGRRFVHARVLVDDVRQLSDAGPFAWSEYRFDDEEDVFEFRQTVGPPAAGGSSGGRHLPWTGEELVGFRLHLPSEVLFHNSPAAIERGNILVWEQPLAARLRGEPVELQVQLETESILFTTLVLFGSTVAAVVLTVAVVIWWIARRGRGSDVAAG